MSNGGIGILSSITGVPVRYGGGGGGGAVATIAWTTTSPLTSASVDNSYSTTLVAVATGGTVSYSIVSGSLPGGLTLNTSTGVISGTANQTATSTFTARATITSTTVSADRTFALTVAAPLYTFTNATFTSAGLQGRAGPPLSTARTGLTGAGTDAWKTNTEFFNTTNGIQLWTVPRSGTYRIITQGARGGRNFSYSTLPGFGARITSDHVLTQGEIVRILVGHVGENLNSNCGGAPGGGGTFVVRAPYNTEASILSIAGGGGGVGTSGSNAGQGGRVTQSGSSDTGGAVPGGVAGSGGARPPGTPCDIIYVSGSGGGFFTSGGGPGGPPGASELTGGGFAFIFGGLGGDRSRGTNGSNFADGGFGGGGMGNYGAGAGGGYSGGGGGQGTSCTCAAWNGGGGGGSYITGTNQSSIANTQIGDGQGEVIITLL